MGIDSGDPFLRDSWERSAQRERGVDSLDQAVRVYIRMEEIVAKHPELQSLMDSVSKDVLRYIASIHSMSSRQRQENFDKDLVQGSDQARRLAHDSLVSVMQAFSRNLYKMGIENDWMGDVVQSRDSIASWALNASLHIERKVLADEQEEEGPIIV